MAGEIICKAFRNILLVHGTASGQTPPASLAGVVLRFIFPPAGSYFGKGQLRGRPDRRCSPEPSRTGDNTRCISSTSPARTGDNVTVAKDTNGKLWTSAVSAHRQSPPGAVTLYPALKVQPDATAAEFGGFDGWGVSWRSGRTASAARSPHK